MARADSSTTLDLLQNILWIFVWSILDLSVFGAAGIGCMVCAYVEVLYSAPMCVTARCLSQMS